MPALCSIPALLVILLLLLPHSCAPTTTPQTGATFSALLSSTEGDSPVPLNITLLAATLSHTSTFSITTPVTLTCSTPSPPLTASSPTTATSPCILSGLTTHTPLSILNTPAVNVTFLTITAGKGVDSYGSGLLIFSSTATFHQTTIHNNKGYMSTWGAGCYIKHSTVDFHQSKFTNNRMVSGTGNKGGAVYVDTGSVVNMVQCVIEENNAVYGGGICE